VTPMPGRGGGKQQHPAHRRGTVQTFATKTVAYSARDCAQESVCGFYRDIGSVAFCRHYLFFLFPTASAAAVTGQ
jgi:hypothetical protein